MLLTNHLKVNMELAPVVRISRRGADTAYAFNGYLGVTVQQFLYAKHKRKLRYPQLPVLCVPGGKNHFYYYAIECLSLIENKDV